MCNSVLNYEHELFLNFMCVLRMTKCKFVLDILIVFILPDVNSMHQNGLNLILNQQYCLFFPLYLGLTQRGLCPLLKTQVELVHSSNSKSCYIIIYSISNTLLFIPSISYVYKTDFFKKNKLKEEFRQVHHHVTAKHIINYKNTIYHCIFP